MDQHNESTPMGQDFYPMVFDEMINGFAVHEIICDDQGHPVDYRFLSVNPAFEILTNLSAKQIIGKRVLDVLPNTESSWIETYGHIALEGGHAKFENYSAALGKHFSISAFRPAPGQFACFFEDITEQKHIKESLERRVIALTQPVDSVEKLHFEDLFDLQEIQALQDSFSKATGVASIITHTDGTPITEPSNFCRLCRDIIRKTEAGCANCYKSDAALGGYHPDGPSIEHCHSSGLWDAGASISIGGRHIANWLIGQVRDETQTDETMRDYAKVIGADEDEFLKAFHEVPAMRYEQFEQIAQSLFTLAKQLSTMAYQNVQQARFIADRKQAQEEIEHLARFPKENPSPVLRIHADGTLLFANPAASALLETHQELLDGTVLGLWKSAVSEALDSGSTLRKEFEYRGAVYAVRFTPIIAMNYVNAYGIDITDRKQAQEQIRQSEGKLRAYLEHSPVCTKILDLDFNLQYMSNAGVKALNIEDVNEFYGKPYPFSFYPDSFKTQMIESLETACATGQSVAQEASVYDLDGKKLWFHSTITPVNDEDGQLDYLMVISMDITDRKQAEEARREKEENLRVTLNSIGDAVIATDAQGRVTQMNPIAETLTGWSLNEAAGKLLTEVFHIIHAHTRKPAENPAEKVLSTGEIVGLANHTALIAKDGTEYQIADSGAPIRNDKGETIGVVLVFRDVTDEYALQDQLRQAQKMEAVGQLAGGIAHDFNNLLQAILGYGEMAIEEIEKDTPTHEFVLQMTKAADHAKTLTSQLLAFSRRQVLEMEDLNLNDVIADLMKMIQRLLGEHITLATLPGHGLGTIRADRGQLGQILTNLCVNARDAMVEGGEIVIETENVRIDESYCQLHSWASPGRYILLCVTDSGHGMDSGTLSHIYDPFFTTKETGKGTGLGLSTVYGLVKQHNGMVSAYSEIGKGTTFKIYLPVVERVATAIGDKIDGPIPNGTETILLAEDDAMVRDVCAEMLSQSGYTVLTACDGEEAVAVFKEHQDEIDMAILDVVMPNLGGKGVYDHISAAKPSVRFLFASGYSLNAIHTNFVLYEGLSLIQKPYQRAQLLRKVRSVLD
ncbi:MAG: PAS domain S-box protein [Phycisphaerales bacterium]|jgi:two-component system, cell cycle sensor histidine kinase and response regulator CckA|nr:PAS domain S-box protein [Phycisphaerales bacterium]